MDCDSLTVENSLAKDMRARCEECGGLLVVARQTTRRAAATSDTYFLISDSSATRRPPQPTTAYQRQARPNPPEYHPTSPYGLRLVTTSVLTFQSSSHPTLFHLYLLCVHTSPSHLFYRRQQRPGAGDYDIETTGRDLIASHYPISKDHRQPQIWDAALCA